MSKKEDTVNKKYFLSLIIVFSFFLGGCALVDITKTASPSPTVQPAGNDQQLVGGDRDEHGCIGSAGYTWCEPKQKCLREWEEPCTQQEVFDLLMNLKNSTTIDFSGIGQEDIQWLTENNPINLKAKSVGASGVADTELSQIDSFFENQGFVRDNYNAADSPTAGLEGFVKGNIGCQVYKEYTNVDSSNPNAPVTVLSNKIDITVSCVELN